VRLRSAEAGRSKASRDVPSFVEGDTFSDCRDIVWSDGQLVACSELLRRYHDAVAGSALAGDEKSSVTATTARGTSSVDAYDIELDIAAAIDLALEQARARFTEHGWDETLVELAAERAWLVANSAAF
jgi:hypothetical protein